MPKSPLFSLQQILYRLTGAATQEARATLDESEPDKPGRFPVSVRPETRVFLEAQAQLWGGSIASVAGTILDGLAMTELKGGEAAMRGTAERLALLIEEHDLSYPAAAELLVGVGITLGDLSSAEALREKLTSKAIREIASRFCVSYDWLAGKSNTMTEVGLHTWYKAAHSAANSLWEAKQSWERVKLLVVTPTDTDLEIKDDGDDYRKLPHVFPVLQKERTLPGGERFVAYEIWEEGRWSYWRCRHYLKLLFYFAERAGIYSIGKRVSDEEYRQLYNGKILPVTVFKMLGHTTWHPDDYVPFGNRKPTRDAEEWASIANSDMYSSTFRHFEELLAQGRMELHSVAQ